MLQLHPFSTSQGLASRGLRVLNQKMEQERDVCGLKRRVVRCESSNLGVADLPSGHDHQIGAILTKPLEVLVVEQAILHLR